MYNGDQKSTMPYNNKVNTKINLCIIVFICCYFVLCLHIVCEHFGMEKLKDFAYICSMEGGCMKMKKLQMVKLLVKTCCSWMLVIHL